MFKNWKLLFFTLCITLFGTACIRKALNTIEDIQSINQIDWEPEFAIPLVKSSLGIQDLVDQSIENYVEIDENNFITIVNEGILTSLDAGTLVDLQDNSYVVTAQLTNAQRNELINNGSVTANASFSENYDQSSVVIDSMHIKNGYFLVDITSTYSHSGSLTLTFPGISKNGVVVTRTYPINYSGSPVQVTDIIDLTNHKIDMTQGTQGNNDLEVETSLTLNNSGNGVLLTDRLDLSLKMNSVKYRALFGYAGSFDFSLGKDSVAIDIFKNDDNLSNIYLEDPSIEFKIINSFGIPVSMKLTDVAGYRDGNDMAITGIPDPIAVPVPAQPYGVEENTYVLDRNSSNVFDLFQFKPKSITYNIETEANPGGVNNNFIIDTSKLETHFKVEVPLHGWAKRLSLEQTSNFSLGDELPNVDEVNEATLRIAMNNGFPFAVGVQVYFIDEFDTVIDSLIADTKGFYMESADIDGNGKVTNSKPVSYDVTFDKVRVQRLNNTRKIKVKGRLDL